MTRYRDGATTPNAAVPYDTILKRFDDLRLAKNSRALQIASELVRHCRTKCSAACYAQELHFWLGWCADQQLDVFRVTPADVDRFMSSIAHYAVGTQHLKLLVARLFFDRSINRGWLNRNPVSIPSSVRPVPETPTPSLTKEQAERLLGAIRADSVGERRLTAMRDYALITVMIRLCLRTEECINLRWGRFSESGGRRQMAFRGKGNKPGLLPVPQDVWATLEAYKATYEVATGAVLAPSDPVFLPVSNRDRFDAYSRVGTAPLRPMGRGTVYAVVRGRLADVGLEGDRYAPHALRATGATLSYEAGSSLIEVQALLRHSSPDTTMRYLQRLVHGAAGPAIDRITIDVAEWGIEPTGGDADALGDEEVGLDA